MNGWSKRKEKFIQENAFKQKREKPGLKCNAGLALVGFPSIGCDLAAVHIIGVSTRLELTVLARDDFKRVPVNRLEQINALKPWTKHSWLASFCTRLWLKHGTFATNPLKG